MPGTQTITMMLQEVEQIISIGGIIFAVGGGESLAILGEGGRVDRIEHEEVVLEQRVDQWPARLLETDGDWLISEALAQREGPLLQSCRRVFDDGLFALSGARVQKTNGVLLIGPIDGHQGSIL